MGATMFGSINRNERVPRTAARLCATALVAGLASACGAEVPAAKAPETCPAVTVTVSLLASARVNPTPRGEPRPVVVRVYELASDVRLLNAKFDQVWKNDKAAFGDDLVSVREEEVYPGTRLDETFAQTERIQYVAAVALFQGAQGRSWFSSAELPRAAPAGQCTEKPGCDGDNDDCPATQAARAPHIAFFLDGTQVDDGVEHLESFPTADSTSRVPR